MLASRIKYGVYCRFAICSSVSFVTDVNQRSSPSQTERNPDVIYRSQPTNNLHSEHVTLNTYSQAFEAKWTDALSFYETFTHVGDVREAHEKIVDIQNRLMEAQQRRIHIMSELTIARREQQIIQDELANCTRSQDRYLGLVRLEIDVSFFYGWQANILRLL